jgi:hypothetical protein
MKQAQLAAKQPWLAWQLAFLQQPNKIQLLPPARA